MKIQTVLCAAALAALSACTGDVDDTLDPEAETDVDEISASAAIAPGTYRLVRRGSEKCLDVVGGGTADGTRVQQLACNDGDAQSFRVEASGDGHRLVHVASSKCLDVVGAGTATGTRLQILTCGASAAQTFRIEARGNDTHRLVDLRSGKCVEVQGASSADRATVRLATCSTSSAQRWRFEAIGDDPTPPAPGNPLWGNAVVTAYTFQDNSACNSIMTSSGRPLVPYVSVALPFRFLRSRGGGPFELGDQIHVSFLEGRTMPNGQRHTGWVRIDDFCGDHGDDEYCFQNGEPNVDLYIGDWAMSGMTCVASNPQREGSGGFSGPAGDGQEDTQVRFGPAPAGRFVTSYGGRAIGAGNCGDCAFGKTVQPPACWHYDPGDTNVEYCSCQNSNGRNGECD